MNIATQFVLKATQTTRNYVLFLSVALCLSLGALCYSATNAIDGTNILVIADYDFYERHLEFSVKRSEFLSMPLWNMGITEPPLSMNRAFLIGKQTAKELVPRSDGFYLNTATIKCYGGFCYYEFDFTPFSGRPGQGFGTNSIIVPVLMNGKVPKIVDEPVAKKSPTSVLRDK